MKRLLVSTIVMTSALTACGGQNTIQQNLLAQQPAISAQSAQKNMFESYKGSFKSADKNDSFDKSGLSEMLMTVKGITGSTKYENKSSIVRYQLQLPGMDSSRHSLDVINGKVRFGKDGNLYFENAKTDFNTHKTEYTYFKIGNYKKFSSSVNDGAQVEYKTDKNVKFDYMSGGLNPMNHDRIRIVSKTVLKAQKKSFSDFI